MKLGLHSFAIALACAGSISAQTDHASSGTPTRAHPPVASPQTSGGKAPDATSPHAAAPGGTPTSPSSPAANAAGANVPDESAPVPDVPAYPGTLAEGLTEMEHLSDAEKHADALHIGDQLLAPTAFLRWKARAAAEEGWKKKLIGVADPALDALGVNGVAPADRAAVHFAKGVVHSRAGQTAGAIAEYEAARSSAGPGELRLDAIYNLGTSDLMEGEAQRAEIPEIKGAQNPAGGAPPSAPPPVNPSNMSGGPGGPGAGAPPADPLELAKQAYLRARDHFVERLRADWRDADARANTELIARRLKELEELKKKREEQKKQESDKQEQQQKQDDKDKKKSDQDKQDKPQDSKDKQDKDKPKDPKDGESDQPKPDDKEQKPPEEKKSDEAKPEESKKDEPKDAEAGEQKEQLLTKEEVMRLLDRLNQIEQKGREMQMQLRHQRRAKVKKDW